MWASQVALAAERCHSHDAKDVLSVARKNLCVGSNSLSMNGAPDGEHCFVTVVCLYGKFARSPHVAAHTHLILALFLL